MASSTSKQFNLFLSDSAWEGLILKGRTEGWVRGNRVWGMSRWMTHLLLENPTPDDWEDARPDWAVAVSLAELEAGNFPVWDEGEPRSIRALVLTEEAKGLTADLAKILGVVRMGRGLKQTPLVSEFWEAVGIGWLIPKHHATAPTYKTMPRKRKVEWDWTAPL